MTEATREVLRHLQVELPDLDGVVGLMSGGQRQAVAVSRAVVFATKVVILDEPTAALGVRESQIGSMGKPPPGRRLRRRQLTTSPGPDGCPSAAS
jgi:ABC-type uncharacterized transport system ATPase component